MADCDQGYFCEACLEYVDAVNDSDLYLRFVMGLVAPEELMRARERHVRCRPALAQYIVDPNFEPVEDADPATDRRQQPEDTIRSMTSLVTRAWRRLQEIPGSGLSIAEYPLSGVEPAWRDASFTGADPTLWMMQRLKIVKVHEV
jgi:hypothetical protein